MADYKYIRVRIDLWNRMKMVLYLEKQAKNGWLFCGFEEKRWRFQAVEPQIVHFTVTYFAGYKADDYEAGQKMVEFREYCAHDGWQFAGCYEEVQVFYNLNENPLPIDTDPCIEVETMHAIALRKLKPQLKRFALFTAFLMALALYAYYTDPVRLFLHTLLLMYLVAYVGGFLVYLLRVLEEFLWLHQAKRYAEQHGAYPYDLKHVRISTVVGVVTALLVFEITIRFFGPVSTLWMTGVLAAVLSLIYWSLHRIDNLPFSKRTCGIIGLVCTVAIVFTMAAVLSRAMSAFGVGEELYAPMGSTWAQYEEIPPLQIEEYYGDGLDDLFYSSYVEETPFLAKYSAWMHADRGEDYLVLDYEILEVKWDVLYNLCVEEYVHGIMKGSCCYTDAAPWGAQTACFRGSEEIPTNLWLLCYEDRIILLYVSEDPTPEQMAQIGMTLGNEQNFANNEK